MKKMAFILGTLLCLLPALSVPVRAGDDVQLALFQPKTIFHSGLVSFAGLFTIPFGPGVSTNLQIVMDGPGTGVDPTSLWTYTPTVVQEDYNYLTFTDDTNLANADFSIHTQFGNDTAPLDERVTVMTGSARCRP